jgi:hypothetical protein
MVTAQPGTSHVKPHMADFCCHSKRRNLGIICSTVTQSQDGRPLSDQESQSDCLHNERAFCEVMLGRAAFSDRGANTGVKRCHSSAWTVPERWELTQGKGGLRRAVDRCRTQKVSGVSGFEWGHQGGVGLRAYHLHSLCEYLICTFSLRSGRGSKRGLLVCPVYHPACRHHVSGASTPSPELTTPCGCTACKCQHNGLFADAIHPRSP